MTEVTRVSPEEMERRENYLRSGWRKFRYYDPYTWSYPYKAALMSASVCVTTISAHNMLYRRTWYYGLYPRAAVTAFTVLCAYGMGRLREHNWSTRDAVVDHYKELHKDEFERVDDFYGRPFASVLQPWIPVRVQYHVFE